MKNFYIKVFVVLFITGANPIYGADVYIFDSTGAWAFLTYKIYGGWKCAIGDKFIPEIKRKQYAVINLPTNKYYLVCDKGGTDDLKLQFDVKKDDVYIEINMDLITLNEITMVLNLPDNFEEKYERVH